MIKAVNSAVFLQVCFICTLQRSVLSTERNIEKDKLVNEENKEFKNERLGSFMMRATIFFLQWKRAERKKYIPVKATKMGFRDVLLRGGTWKNRKKVENLIAQMGNNLQSGNIEQNPIQGKNHDKTCEFCDYASVCANRRSIKNREIDALKDEEVLEILKEE